MKHERPLSHFFLAMACLFVARVAADDAPTVPAANVQIQIIGGGRLQLQAGGAGVQVAGGGAQTNEAMRILGQAPVIFFPCVPTFLLPNPLARADAKPGFLGVELEAEGNGAGVGIARVIGGSPAAEAGLKEGDRVLKFEGREAKDSVQLREMIRAEKPEQAVKMTVRRGGKEMEIKAKLGAAPVLQLNGGILIDGQIVGGNEPLAVPGVVTFHANAIPGIPMAGKLGTAQIGSSTKNARADTGTVSLRDGNRFLGKIRGIDPAKGLLLQRDGLPDLELIEEEIAGLTFAGSEAGNAAPETKNAAARSKVLVQLRDGSLFNGDALTMEHGTLLLTLHGGQRIEIPREQAQSLTLSDGESVQIYDGPTGLAGWTSGRTNQGQWEYKDGLLRCLSNGPIGRDLGHMPDPLDFSFDVIFPKRIQRFGVTLFSGGVGQSSAGTLTLQFSPGQIHGSHYDGQRSNQYNSDFQQQVGAVFFGKPETVRYRVLVDRVKGKALIFIDGKKLAEWKLSTVKPEEIGECGGTFSITPNVSMSGTAFTIGRVRVLPWDGREPANAEELPAPKGDQVLAQDGKATDGSIERITAGEIVFANPAATVRRDRTLFVRFAPPAAPKEFPAALAMARLKNGSEFAVAQARGGGETLTLTTRYGSRITVPFSALRGLDFLPRAGRAEVSAGSADVLTLTDGTQLKGSAVTPFSAASVRWKIAASKARLEYPLANVAGIFFSQPDDADRRALLKGDSVVRLGNGDWLPGDVAALDGDRLVLKTSLAPELIVPLAELRGIYLNPEVAATLGDGVSGPRLWSEGWKLNQSNLRRQAEDAAAKSESPWMYHDGSYTLTGTARGEQAMIAQRWPAYAGAYALNLDLTISVRSPPFSVQLFNSKDERTFTATVVGTRVYVYFHPNTAKLNGFAAGGKHFQIEGTLDSGSDNTRVAIVLDRPAKTFRVFMAGKEIGKIAFKDDEAKEALDACGMALTPMSFSSGRQNRIAGIWLAPWTGPLATASATEEKPEAAPDPELKKTPAPPPTIHLANGDEFTGTIATLNADRIAVESDAGPLELPGKRVMWIQFPGAAAAAPADFPRLRFHDRGRLSVKDLEIGTDRVQCRTLHGQSLEFPLNLVKEIVWRALEDK